MLTSERWFAEKLASLPQSDEARAYTVGVLNRYVHAEPDDVLHGTSLVVALTEARSSGDFVKFQRLGDWILWALCCVPESIKHDAIVEVVGQLSYNACFRLLRRQWHVYEELADELPVLTARVHRLLIVP